MANLCEYYKAITNYFLNRQFLPLQQVADDNSDDEAGCQIGRQGDTKDQCSDKIIFATLEVHNRKRQLRTCKNQQYENQRRER